MALLLPVLAGCLGPAPVAGQGYEATIRWTSYGIPHVLAQDWGGLGFGVGYAEARDDLCMMAEEYVTVKGERSLHWRPSDTYRIGGNGVVLTNEQSDFFWHLYNGSPDLLEPTAEHLNADFEAGAQGYAAGYNKYLRDTGKSNLPAACRDAAWVEPITKADVVRRASKLQLMASSLAFAAGIADAAPPLSGGAPARSAPVVALPTPESLGIGSNAFAFGKDATADGRGLLLGNPHFPWTSPERFHEVHLTIPGQVDVMGAALLGVPLVLIGFNEAVAWSHTVSTGWRFTLHELTLAPGDPTSYVVDGGAEPMQPRQVTIQVRGEAGQTEERTRTFYTSRWGPLVSLSGVLNLPGSDAPHLDLTWTPLRAFALQDSNAHNTRIVEHFFRADTARSFDAFKANLDETLGVPWVNTIAASPDGRALYADKSVVPDLSAAQIEQCNTPLGRATYAQARVPILDGSRSACGWAEEPGAKQKGTIPPDKMPLVERSDWVLNSNDSHWLPNPASPLEGFSPMIGDERTPRSARTRMGYVLAEERLGGKADCAIDPTVPCDKMTPRRLEAALFSERIFTAELARDALVEGACTPAIALSSAGQPVDLTAACQALRAWDLRALPTSKGTALWERFWGRSPAVWTQPFDPADAVRTPAGYVGADPRARRSLADAVLELQAAHVALDAAQGDVHFVTRHGERIPLRGNLGTIGTFDVLNSPFAAGKGFAEPIHGSSYIQVVTFDARGPVADAILTYSQSPDAESPHSADQTRLFSQGQWLRLPFHEADILADPNLETLRVRG